MFFLSFFPSRLQRFLIAGRTPLSFIINIRCSKMNWSAQIFPSRTYRTKVPHRLRTQHAPEAVDRFSRTTTKIRFIFILFRQVINHTRPHSFVQLFRDCVFSKRTRKLLRCSSKARSILIKALHPCRTFPYISRERSGGENSLSLT